MSPEQQIIQIDPERHCSNCVHSDQIVAQVSKGYIDSNGSATIEATFQEIPIGIVRDCYSKFQKFFELTGERYIMPNELDICINPKKFKAKPKIAEANSKTCVAGSISKFKPEIDLAIDELTDLGFTVLSPEKGWIYKPPQKIFNPEEEKFRRLPTEQDMTIKNIEDDFLANIHKSDFLFVVDPGGYIGNSTCMEIGFALAAGKPVFLSEEPNPLLIESTETWNSIKDMLLIFDRNSFKLR